jgi:hypothetical protein
VPSANRFTSQLKLCAPELMPGAGLVMRYSRLSAGR